MELELSLQQKQILSQRMQLSVRILQMNALDLNQYIKDNALENPLLELETEIPQEDPTELKLKKLEWLDAMDQSNSFQYRRDGDEEHNQPLYDKNPAESLTDTLLAQLPAMRLAQPAEDAARYIIGNLDDNGYLASPREDLVRETGVEEAVFDEALGAIQRMDPPGVAAEDLTRCLLLQAQRRGDISPVLLTIIEHHLDTLAKNQLGRLAKTLGVSLEEIKRARDELLTLNPKPGNGFSSYNSIPYIRPDLFIVRFEESFQVILNDYSQPRITINSFYRDLAQEDAETAAYVKTKLGQAEWLVTCIQQRKNTILRCAGSILRRQMRFFENGPGNLVPMTLADVAGDLEVHPSTVSRTVRGKYLQCQWGVFGLSDFFSHGVSEAGGEEQSQDMILGQIRRIIEEEDPKKPFSDQDIADQLTRQGIGIARRTVANYRKQLGFPNASGRREF